MSLQREQGRSEVWPGPVIDADLHAVVPSVQALYPYLDPVWIHHCEDRGWLGPTTAVFYPPALPSTARPQWRPSDGRVPASEVELLREHVLDPWNVERAIVNCVYAVDSGPPDVSAALAAAVNDWLIAEWLDVEPRLRASIVLPSRNDPAAIVAEIDRVGGHPGFVQALLPARSGILYGKRLWWPVFEAIVRNDLVAGIHFGGSNDGLPPTASGWPSYYVEEYVSEIQVFESQLISLIGEGTFQKFPELRVSMLEAGFTWVPMWMWNIDRNWRGMRREVPWLRRPPFADVREHVRFSTAPFDADLPEELAHFVRWLGSEELIMFATDYPHLHDDDVAVLLEAVPESMRPKVMADNARGWYRL
jgi:predicted TIM-barrel fold metal-dependent hydrolase